MHKFITLILAFAALTLFVGEAPAVETTPGKVQQTCGSKLQAGCLNLACAYGCETQCGDTICTWNCCGGPSCGEQGCHVHPITRTIGGKKVKIPSAAYVRMYGRHVRPSSVLRP
jgi:hypothetical protein